jgi:hypothetical protein
VTVTGEVVAVEKISEDPEGVKAILKDQSGAIDIKTWDETWLARLEELEGETIALQDAEVYWDDYDETRKLAPVEGLTDIKSIQRGVGYTEEIEPDSDDQGQLETTSVEAAADGGTLETEPGEDTAAPPPDGNDESAVPDDAEGMLADARRLVELLEQEGVPLSENEVITAASMDRGLMDPDRAEQALCHAVEERGMIMETEDGYEPT